MNRGQIAVDISRFLLFQALLVTSAPKCQKMPVYANHRPRLIDAGRRHGVYRLRVFGSRARGDADTASDVDLLVDLDPDRTLLDLVAFQHEAEAILNKPVDVATADMLKKRIRAEVLAEARSLE